MVAASGAEVLLSARRAAASAATPLVQDFHHMSSRRRRLARRILKPRARPPDLGGLARGRRDDHPQVWRASRDFRAYHAMPRPALLRLLLYANATSRGRRRKCRHLRGVLYHSSPAPCRSMRTSSCPRRPIASATNTWLLPREVGPSSDMEDRVPQSRAKPRVTPLVTISD